MKTTARQLTLCAMLTALALALSWVERFLPLSLLIPLPGIKLGLANVVTLFALCALGPLPTGGILLARCFLGSLFAGSLSGLIFSLSGGILSLFVMLLMKKTGLSVYGISVCGAAAHNVGQILAAMGVMKTAAVVSYLPLLLLVSVPAGLITGAMTAGVIRAFSAAGLRRLLPGEKGESQ